MKRSFDLAVIQGHQYNILIKNPTHNTTKLSIYPQHDLEKHASLPLLDSTDLPRVQATGHTQKYENSMFIRVPRRGAFLCRDDGQGIDSRNPGCRCGLTLRYTRKHGLLCALGECGFCQKQSVQDDGRTVNGFGCTCGREIYPNKGGR